MTAASKQQQIGDVPIDPAVRGQMSAVARILDRVFNGNLTGKSRKVGFVLMVFNFGDDQGRTNYISNADRDDVVLTLKHQIKRFEGQPNIKGTA